MIVHQQQQQQRLLKRSTSIPEVGMGSLSRSRSRSTCASFEQDKDCISIWLNSLDSHEIGRVLEGTVRRCNLTQLGFLWTVLESIPHHEFLYHLKRMFPSVPFPSLSTPVSRHFKQKFEISRRKENKILFRMDSILVNSEITKSLASQLLHSPQTTPQTTPLPDLRPSTAPELEYGRRKSAGYRMVTPTRRHMQSALSRVGTPSCYKIVASSAPPPGRGRGGIVRQQGFTSTASSPRSPTILSPRPPPPPPPPPLSSSPYPSLFSPHYLEAQARSWEKSEEYMMFFFKWFSSLQKDWQQKDILHLLVWCLEERELYYLTTLLLSCQYRDFVSDLPVDIVRRILSHVPGKDLLLACSVSQVWNDRCSCNKLWRIKCSQVPLGLTPSPAHSWKRLYIDDIKLKRNWRLGRSIGRRLESHSHRVLSVRVKEGEDIGASGSSDQTIKIWSLKDGRLLNTIYTHSKNIWCLSFYGINFIISGSGDGSVRIWNYRTGTCERCLQGHTGTVWSLTRKKDILITGSHDKTAILWNIRHCKYNTQLIGHSGAVFCVDINDTATEAYTASGDKTVRIWSITEPDPQCIRCIKISTHQPVMSLSYSEGLIACSAGSMVSLWSVTNGEKITDFKGHNDRVEALHLLTSGSNANTVISGGRDGLIKYWNINSGRCIRTLRNKPGSIINEIHRDNTRLLCGCDDYSVQVMHFDPNIISEFEEGERGERGGRGGSLGSGRRAGTAGNIRQGVIVNSTISPTVTKRNTNSACNGGSKRKTSNRQ